MIIKLIHRKNSINRIIINHTQVKFNPDSLHSTSLDFDVFLGIEMVNIRLHQNDKFTFIRLGTNVFHIEIKLHIVAFARVVKLHLRL